MNYGRSTCERLFDQLTGTLVKPNVKASPRSGADRHLGPETANQPGPMEPAQPVLDGALGQLGQTDELAGREHAVLAQQAEQPPIGRGQPSQRAGRRHGPR